jgi:hypothetical protein
LATEFDAVVAHVGVELLAGDPNFVRDWNAYLVEMNKGKAGAAPGANAIDCNLRSCKRELQHSTCSRIDQ